MVVADAGYGASTPFRLALEERGLSYVVALTGKEVAHPEAAEPHQPAYAGLGPPTLPRYRTSPRSLPRLAAELPVSRYAEVTWREGSKGPMTSRFALLRVRPAGKQALRAAQETGGGHYEWDGVLPVRTVLVEWPSDETAPTGYWTSNLPAATPIEDLVRWAKMRAHRARLPRTQARPGPWTTSKAALGGAGTTTSPWSPPPRPSSPSTGSTQKPIHRRDSLPRPRRHPGPPAVLGRNLHHLRTPPTHHTQQKKTAPDLTKHY